MKDAAKCAMQCDLQTSVNHWIFERIRRRLTSGGRSVSAPSFRLLHKLCACAGALYSEHLMTIHFELCVVLGFGHFQQALGRLKPSVPTFSWDGGFFALMGLSTPHSRPDVGSEDPLNLSISLSVGTETK